MGSITTVALVIGYILIMLGIGYWSSRRVKSVSDFMLGGRTVGPWMNAFAYATSAFTPWLIIGLSGELGWYFGLKAVWAGLLMTLLGVALAWLALAGRAREMSARLHTITLAEFFGARFRCEGTQGVAAVITVSFSFLLAASVYAGLAYLAQAILGVKPLMTLLFLALLSAVTLALGGYFDLAVGGFVRGIIQFICVFLLLAAFADQHGLLHHAWPRLVDYHHFPKLFSSGSIMLDTAFYPAVNPAIYLAATALVLGLGMWGMPHVALKFFAMRRRADMPIATTVSGVFGLLLAFGIFFIGALSRLYFTPEAMPAMPHLITDMVTMFFNDRWHELLMLSLVVSAAMNLLSSILLVTAGGIVLDLGGVVLKRPIRDRAALRWLRILIFVLAGLSLLLASLCTRWLEGILITAWCAMAGAFVMPFAYSLFWKRATKMGVVIGMLAGLGMALTLIARWGFLEAPLAGTLAMTISFLVVPLVSLLTKAPSQERVDAAFTDKASLPTQRGTDIVFGDLSAE